MGKQLAFKKKSLTYTVYFTLLGLTAFGAGAADLIVTISSSTCSFGFVEIPSDGFRGGWGGLVMLFAGIFYLSGIRDANEIHQFARVVLASVLVWVLAGTDLFSMVARSIPSPDAGRWLNTPQGILQAFAPPYTPAVVLLPFTLVIVRYIRSYHREKDAA